MRAMNKKDKDIGLHIDNVTKIPVDSSKVGLHYYINPSQVKSFIEFIPSDTYTDKYEKHFEIIDDRLGGYSIECVKIIDNYPDENEDTLFNKCKHFFRLLMFVIFG